MPVSDSASRLKAMINKAIDDHQLSRAEMDQIQMLATEDGHIDPQEQALLNELHEMIQNKMVKVIP
jgi:tellurite resistance protein